MSSTALSHRPTPRLTSSVANIPRKDAPLVDAVLDVLRPLPYRRGGWRKRDLCRGRTSILVNLFATIRELKEGGATAVQIETVNMVLSNAIRVIATEGLPSTHRTFADFQERETRCEGEENLLQIAAREHASPGTYRAFAAAMAAENAAQQEFIDWLNAEAIRMEGGE